MKHRLKLTMLTLYDIHKLTRHGRMVTSSRQITEVKQRRARLVLGWVSHAAGHV